MNIQALSQPCLDFVPVFQLGYENVTFVVSVPTGILIGWILAAKHSQYQRGSGTTGFCCFLFLY